MWRKVRELDFDAIVEHIRRSTNVAARKACDPIIQSDLAFIKCRADAADNLRDHVALAALDDAKSVDDIRESDPLVRALVRAQHHPDVRPIPRTLVRAGLDGDDAAPRLKEIVAAHPELTWDPDDIQRLLIRAIVDGAGDVEVDDDFPPWQISWEPMGAAAYTLITLVTLRTLGEL